MLIALSLRMSLNDCVPSINLIMNCLDFSDAQGPSTSGVRRSNRLSKKDDDAQTPQNILRRSLKHKIREVNKKSRVFADRCLVFEPYET